MRLDGRHISCAGTQSGSRVRRSFGGDDILGPSDSSFVHIRSFLGQAGADLFRLSTVGFDRPALLHSNAAILLVPDLVMIPIFAVADAKEARLTRNSSSHNAIVGVMEQACPLFLAAEIDVLPHQ